MSGRQVLRPVIYGPVYFAAFPVAKLIAPGKKQGGVKILPVAYTVSF